MKVSLIVPVYNRLEHLRAQFKCLLEQEIMPYEVIITDDGSNEDILSYIEDLLPLAKFNVKHIYQQDKGFRKTRALNNGARNASGEVLLFSDQDLVFGTDYIKIVLEKIKSKHFLHFRPYNLSELERNDFLKLQNLDNFNYKEFTKKLPIEYRKSVNKTLKKDKLRRLLNNIYLRNRGIKLVGMSYAIYKNDYIKVNGYDEKYEGWGYEDDDFGNRLYSAGIKGREAITENIQLHLWHEVDPTKKKSQNENYYKNRKNLIFNKNDYYPKYGYDNSLENDFVKVKILKEV
ncbi:MAG: glycosyltransferase [Fusobacteriaceae bacterium]